MFGEGKAGTLRQLDSTNSEGECGVWTKAWWMLLWKGSHPPSLFRALPAHQPMPPVSALFCPSHCPGNKYRPGGLRPQPRGGRGHEGESQLLASGSHTWKSLDTNNRGVWRALSLPGLLLRKGRGSVKLGLGASERSSWEDTLTTKTELKQEG